MLESVPAGYLVDSPTLERHGVTRQLAHRYVESNWLEPVIRGLYRRPSSANGDLNWRTVVRSLQHIMGYSSIVGGHTALEEQGLAQYLSISGERSIHLYGAAHPTWLRRLNEADQFVLHGSKLFDNGADATTDVDTNAGPIVCSTPERAILELIDELPKQESFQIVDTAFEGLASASPRRFKNLLGACRSVKVKRLFFVFADKHAHAWRRHLFPDDIDLGSGPRALVEEGRFHPRYKISVPADLLPESLNPDGT